MESVCRCLRKWKFSDYGRKLKQEIPLEDWELIPIIVESYSKKPKVLWHLDIFRRSFRELAGHTCMLDSCIFCALKRRPYHQELIRSGRTRSSGGRPVFADGVPPAPTPSGFLGLLQGVFLVDIARTIRHYSFTMRPISSKPRRTPSRIGSHSTFSQHLRHPIGGPIGVNVVSRMIFPTSPLAHHSQLVLNLIKFRKYSSYQNGAPRTHEPAKPHFRDLNVQNLSTCFHTFPNTDFQSPSSVSACGAKIQIRRTLTNHPEIVSVGIVWDSDRPSLEHIMSLLVTLRTTLRLSDVFHTPTLPTPTKTSHQLVGVVTYYGKHYSTFFFHTKLKIWIYFDDANVREVGPKWEQVVEKCRRGRYQPLLLLFAAPDGTPVDSSTAPKSITVAQRALVAPRTTDPNGPAAQMARRSLTPSPEKPNLGALATQRRALTPNPQQQPMDHHIQLQKHNGVISEYQNVSQMIQKASTPSPLSSPTRTAGGWSQFGGPRRGMGSELVRRDSGNWSGDRNSASSSSSTSLENPYQYIIGKMPNRGQIVPRSPTSLKGGESSSSGSQCDPGYDSYSLSSTDSLPLQQTLKHNLQGRHSREGSNSSNRGSSGSHSRQGSRDKGNHSRQNSRELLTAAPAPSPAPAEPISAPEKTPEKTPEKSIEIYATLPKTRKGLLSRSSSSKVKNTVEDEEYLMYDRPGRSLNRAKPPMGKKEEKRARSEERNKSSKEKEKEKEKEFVSNQISKEAKKQAKAEEQKNKKQHKIRRKLLMGGLIRRKNRSMPDLREDEVQIKTGSKDDSNLGKMEPQNTLSGYLSEGHLEYSGNPNLERSKLMRKHIHGSKLIHLAKVPPPPPLRTTSQLSKNDRPPFPLPGGMYQQWDDQPQSLPPMSNYNPHTTDAVTYANGGFMMNNEHNQNKMTVTTVAMVHQVGSPVNEIKRTCSDEDFELPPYPSPLNSAIHSRQPSEEFPPPPSEVASPQAFSSLLEQLQLKRQQILHDNGFKDVSDAVDGSIAQPSKHQTAMMHQESWLKELRARQEAISSSRDEVDCSRFVQQEQPTLHYREENMKPQTVLRQDQHESKDDLISTVKDLKSRFENIQVQPADKNKTDLSIVERLKNCTSPLTVLSNVPSFPNCTVQPAVETKPDTEVPKSDEIKSNLITGSRLDDIRRKSNKKKNVTFCEQVVLVATAEEDKSNSYIPNPILERVLRSVLHRDPPHQETKEIAVHSVVPLKRNDSGSYGQCAARTPTEIKEIFDDEVGTPVDPMDKVQVQMMAPPKQENPSNSADLGQQTNGSMRGFPRVISSPMPNRIVSRMVPVSSAQNGNSGLSGNPYGQMHHPHQNPMGDQNANNYHGMNSPPYFHHDDVQKVNSINNNQNGPRETHLNQSQCTPETETNRFAQNQNGNTSATDQERLAAQALFYKQMNEITPAPVSSGSPSQAPSMTVAYSQPIINGQGNHNQNYSMQQQQQQLYNQGYNHQMQMHNATMMKNLSNGSLNHSNLSNSSLNHSNMSTNSLNHSNLSNMSLNHSSSSNSSLNHSNNSQIGSGAHSPYQTVPLSASYSQMNTNCPPSMVSMSQNVSQQQSRQQMVNGQQNHPNTGMQQNGPTRNIPSPVVHAHYHQAQMRQQAYNSTQSNPQNQNGNSNPYSIKNPSPVPASFLVEQHPPMPSCNPQLRPYAHQLQQSAYAHQQQLSNQHGQTQIAYSHPSSTAMTSQGNATPVAPAPSPSMSLKSTACPVSASPTPTSQSCYMPLPQKMRTSQS
ncbi:unnamed protein product, partial [Nesidiocoris tenuis]